MGAQGGLCTYLCVFLALLSSESDGSPLFSPASMVESGRLRAWFSPETGLTNFSIQMTDGGVWTAVPLLRGSGVSIDGCVPSEQLSIVHAAQEGGPRAVSSSSINITRNLVCRSYNETSQHNIVVSESFSAAPPPESTTLASIRWDVLISSDSVQSWTAPISTALGFADWATTKSQAWLGGSRQPDAPIKGSYDPLEPFPPGQEPKRYFYGSGRNNPVKPVESRDGQTTVLPLLTRVVSGGSNGPGWGVSLASSPDDTPITAYASTSGAAGAANAMWLNFTRLYHRLGGEAKHITFASNILAHGPGWRPAALFLVKRYPSYFEPRVDLRAVFNISGTAAYADLRGPVDLDAAAARTYREFGWRLNWDSTARFPWHGEWAPAASDGFDYRAWLTCFSHVAPDGHQGEPCSNVSFPELSSWYEHIRSSGAEAGTTFSSCQYANLFEFGWKVAEIWPPSAPPNCSEAARQASNDTQLRCHTFALLQQKYGPALVLDAEKKILKNETSLICGGLAGSCIMDPDPSLPYLEHLTDMAKTALAQAPSAAVCIDRQDWIGFVNPRGDDLQTWIPDLGSPVRALIFSWKAAMATFGQVWRAAGRPVVINDHSNRLDMMSFVDGIYAEMGDMQSATAGRGSLNSHAVGTSLVSLGARPAFIWNHPKKPQQLTSAYLNAGLQTHLWAGVFPTVPVKNNDHAIGGDCAPNCTYNAVFAAYGPLFGALRGRRWALGSARAAEVVTSNALANLFEESLFLAKSADAPSYLGVVVQGELDAPIDVWFRGMKPGSSRMAASVTSQWPGAGAGVVGTASVRDVARGDACDRGWSDGGDDLVCVQVRIVFNATQNVGVADVAPEGAVVLHIRVD